MRTSESTICHTGTSDTMMRVNITNGEISGISEQMTTFGLLGNCKPSCARMMPATTGTTSGPATLPRSSVRLISDAAAA